MLHMHMSSKIMMMRNKYLVLDGTDYIPEFFQDGLTAVVRLPNDYTKVISRD